ncbi:hypothetical protein [Rhodococcus jostii]|uniref:Uncharacterized protein n=1 Tax=Rhodococcus jostii TaxID=132919 RepID=A0A1H4J730_RHOJO|nr:hypothetical protein [Rhodococcus jostii]SEB42100.1 hypothetical protein SAMN04490220_0682 [Rhodococcus jostii]
MFEPKELREAKKEFLAAVNDCSWLAAKGQLDDPDFREAATSVLRFASSRYRAAGGDIEKTLRKNRSLVESKFQAVELHYFKSTGNFLFADHRQAARNFMEDLVRMAGPVDHASDPTSGAQDDHPDGTPKVPGGEEQTVLPNPRLPDIAPDQCAYEILKSVGLSFLVWGPGRLSDCFRAIANVATTFLSTRTSSGWVGQFSGQSDVYWMAFEGPEGSGVAVCVGPDSDQDFWWAEIAEKLPNLGGQWQWGVGSLEARVPTEFAKMFTAATAVQLWTLPGLEHLTPAEETAEQPSPTLSPMFGPVLNSYPERIQRWQEFDGLRIGLQVVVAPSRAQLVILRPWDNFFALLSPVGAPVGGAIPPAIRDRVAGRYELVVRENDVMLVQPLPETSEFSPEDTCQKAFQLADYADAVTHPDAEPNTAATTSTNTHVPMSSDRHELGSQVRLTVDAKEMGRYEAIRKLDERRHKPNQSTRTPENRRASSPTVAPPSMRASRRRTVVIASLLVAAALVIALATTLVVGRTESTDSARTATAADVTTCTTPPAFSPTKFETDAAGLLVTMQITTTCPGGDVLSNNALRLTLSAGDTNIASALFDLSGTPIAVPPRDDADMTAATHAFRFPIGSFWRTPDTMPTSGIDVTSDNIGTDPVTSPTTGDDSGPSDATGPAAPATGDPETASLEALQAIAAADREPVHDLLVDKWIPQLSSKRPGLVAEGITWNSEATLREHLRLRAQYPGVRLLWSGDWSTFSAPDFWVTVAGTVYPDPDAAIRWCQSHDLDRDHCYGKLISTTHPIDGSTRLQPG